MTKPMTKQWPYSKYSDLAPVSLSRLPGDGTRLVADPSHTTLSSGLRGVSSLAGLSAIASATTLPAASLASGSALA